jgi:hypothetical protein
MPEAVPFVLSTIARLRRAGKGVRLVIGDGAANAVDENLVSLVALGERRDWLATLVRVSYLSPEIVGAIASGQHPVGLTPTRLVSALPEPAA